MSQADSRVTDQRHEHETCEGTCDHFQYTGRNRKDGKSHSLNRKPHCIYQRQQEIASRGRHKELVGIGDDSVICRIQKDQRELFPGQ